jgi:hypothetical protein
VSASVVDFIQSLTETPENAIHLDFLDSYLSPGSKILVHPKTGLVASEKKMDQGSVLRYWSDQVFTSMDDLDYSASYPYAIGRLHYVINTIMKELAGIVDFNRLNLVDFATGEGIFLDIVKSYFPNSCLRGTEGSKFLSEKMEKRGLDVLNVGLGQGENIRFEGAKIATLLWTLSCTANPYKMLQNIYDALPDESYLVVAESSRILVPYKKSLSDMFRIDRPADIHPHYFSANSLVSSLATVGFRSIYLNRFHDSEVLLCIAKKSVPNHNDLLPSDNKDLVIRFFKTWHHLSKDEYVQFPTLIK